MKPWSLCSWLLLFCIVVIQFPIETNGRKWLLGAHVLAKMAVITKLISFLFIISAYGWCPLCTTPFGRRDVDEGRRMLPLPMDLDFILNFIAKNDEQQCIARIICELHAQNDQSNFGNVERNIIALLTTINDVTRREDPSVAIFRDAAALGLASSNPATCQDVYHTCTMERDDLDQALAAANVLTQWGKK